jgi:hypothetical protein
MSSKLKLSVAVSLIFFLSFWSQTDLVNSEISFGLISTAVAKCPRPDDGDPEEEVVDDAPWGKIEDLVIKVGGNDVQRNAFNAVFYKAPKDLQFGGLCKIGLGIDYHKDMNFAVEWRLTNGVFTRSADWTPTLSPGDFDELVDLLTQLNASKNWYGHITIKAEVGNNVWAILATESVSFLPN